MRRYLAVIVAKVFFHICQFLNLGAGGTWPGEIGLRLYPQLITQLSRKIKRGIIIVSGTNGKTTTAKLINQILTKSGFQTIYNATGANLLNGIASALIQKADWRAHINAEYGVFEVDENSLPTAILNLQQVNFPREKKFILVLLNLFRDQLDRYGEVDLIAEKWHKSLKKLPSDTVLILNADDPLIVYLGKGYRKRKVYFGINDKKYFIPKLEHATDSIFCLYCGGRLSYGGIYFSHLGIWRCDRCGEKRPRPDIFRGQNSLPGLYNRYNFLAAQSVGQVMGVGQSFIARALADFEPAFGRQEEFLVNGKKIKLFLSKNPAGFNVSLRTVLESDPKVILLVLNDRIPDGKDISWIWDVDFENIPEHIQLIVSGDRAYDLGLRLKYSLRQPAKISLTSNSELIHYEAPQDKRHSGSIGIKIENYLPRAITTGLNLLDTNETLYILPTYSAMLHVRKILSGRKIF